MQLASTRLGVTTIAVGILVTGAVLPAQASPPPTVETVTTDVGAPFNLAVQGDGVLVADGTRATLSRLTPDGTLSPAADTGGAEEVPGVALGTGGRKAWIQNADSRGTGTLEVRGPDGYTLSVDLYRYESRRNPDQGVRYGVRNPSDCVRDGLEGAGLRADYQGIVDAHPYSVAAGPDGTWYVADSSANDLLMVRPDGTVRTLAVLPAPTLRFTQAQVDANGMPDCVVGTTYRFESVPTDIETGRDGALYVTTFPGGPLDTSLGARGSVWKVDPASGAATLVATGLAGATNLAVGSDGAIYVTELYAGRVSKVVGGKVLPFVRVPGAVSVEAGRTGLWVGTLGGVDGDEPAGDGSVVRVSW